MYVFLIILFYWLHFFLLKRDSHCICCNMWSLMLSFSLTKIHMWNTHKHTLWIWFACPLDADSSRERERPHISLMPFSKYRSKSHTSSGPGGGALDEFSPCLLNPPPPTLCQAVRLSEREGARERLWLEPSSVGSSSTVLLQPLSLSPPEH